MEKEMRKIEGLENFSVKNSNDISFDLYKNFADSEESLRKYGEAFSDFYYISCFIPCVLSEEQEKELEEREDDPEEGVISEEAVDRHIQRHRKYNVDTWKKGVEEWKNDVEQWKFLPEICKILERCNYRMQNGYPIEILIGKYSEESMEKARKITEEKRKEYEGMGFIVGDPRAYMYIIGYFGGTTGRNNHEIIKEIREMFPDKVRVMKARG